MRKINYHIATSLDGYIAHEDGSVEGFLMEGEHADDFVHSFADYDTVLMGRKTYEFGFQFGLTAGEPAYPGMHHFIFSKSMQFQSSEQVTLVASDAVAVVERLKHQQGKDIWLCGGGELAGQLLSAGVVDKLMLKINPVVLGAGRRLFGDNQQAVKLNPVNSKTYDNGVVLVEYAIVY